jgi:hypothetical protein
MDSGTSGFEFRGRKINKILPLLMGKNDFVGLFKISSVFPAIWRTISF